MKLQIKRALDGIQKDMRKRLEEDDGYLGRHVEETEKSREYENLLAGLPCSPVSSTMCKESHCDNNSDNNSDCDCDYKEFKKPWSESSSGQRLGASSDSDSEYQPRGLLSTGTGTGVKKI